MNSTSIKMYVERKIVFQILYFCIKISKCFKFSFFFFGVFSHFDFIHSLINKFSYLRSRVDLLFF